MLLFKAVKRSRVIPDRFIFLPTVLIRISRGSARPVALPFLFRTIAALEIYC